MNHCDSSTATHTEINHHDVVAIWAYFWRNKKRSPKESLIVRYGGLLYPVPIGISGIKINFPGFSSPHNGYQLLIIGTERGIQELIMTIDGSFLLPYSIILSSVYPSCMLSAHHKTIITGAEDGIELGKVNLEDFFCVRDDVIEINVRFFHPAIFGPHTMDFYALEISC